MWTFCNRTKYRCFHNCCRWCRIKWVISNDISYEISSGDEFIFLWNDRRKFNMNEPPTSSYLTTSVLRNANTSLCYLKEIPHVKGYTNSIVAFVDIFQWHVTITHTGFKLDHQHILCRHFERLTNIIRVMPLIALQFNTLKPRLEVASSNCHQPPIPSFCHYQYMGYIFDTTLWLFARKYRKVYC